MDEELRECLKNAIGKLVLTSALCQCGIGLFGAKPKTQNQIRKVVFDQFLEDLKSCDSCIIK